MGTSWQENVAMLELEYTHLKAHYMYLAMLPSDGSVGTEATGRR
jgi:hypothetical protein